MNGQYDCSPKRSISDAQFAIARRKPSLGKIRSYDAKRSPASLKLSLERVYIHP